MDDARDDRTARELRVLRHRLAAIEDQLDRASGDVTPSNPILIGEVFDDGAMPASVPGYFAVHQCRVGGVEAEGETLDVAVSSAEAVFLVLGSEVPAVGDRLIARAQDGRWVAQRGGGAAEPGPRVGTYHVRVVDGTVPATSPPQPYVLVLQEGSAAPVNEIQGIKFAGTITGGTFRLDFFGAPTAAISWTSDNDLLASRVQTALEVDTGINPGQIAVTPFQMTAGIGYLYVEFIGTRGGSSQTDITVFANALTGSALSLTVTRMRGGSANLDEYQQVAGTTSAFSTNFPTGGTFRLEYDGQTTSAIAWTMLLGVPNYTAIAAATQSALEALSNIAVGDVAASGGFSAIVVQFKGTLAATDVPRMTVADNSLTGTMNAKIAGATVSLRHDGVDMSSGITDADGGVSLPLYSAGPGFTIEVTHPDYMPLAYANTPPTGTQITGSLTWGYNNRQHLQLLAPA